MRIIAGRAGGIRLSVPKAGVRPTMDRVKAAIFSSLGDAVIGARVLDLFAGSGALGLEALSRGADSVVFVDQDRQSIATIEENLVKIKSQARVCCREVFRFLEQTASDGRYSIIFADPPYEKTKSGEKFTALLLTDKFIPRLLEKGGTFVLEKSPSEALPEMSFWKIGRRKRYGTTEVLFLSEPHHPKTAEATG